MKRERILLSGIPTVLILLELLPFSAVLNFANPEGEPFRETFSYFSLVPFGYANFGPLITAVLSCVLLVLCVVFCFLNKKGILKTITVLSAIALAASLSPLLFGIKYVTVCGIAISVGLLALLSLSVLKLRKGL